MSIPTVVVRHTDEEDTMPLEPYLFFEGRCEEALEFYFERVRLEHEATPGPPPARPKLPT